MSKAVLFRVVVDHEYDTFRDIVIRSDQRFEDLHNAIQEAYAFDGSQMASFYLSDEEWSKGEEIGLFDMSDEPGSAFRTMDQTEIGDVVETVGQKVLYVFDFLLMWCFFLEVVSIDDTKADGTYPSTIHSFGPAPEQYSKSPDFEGMVSDGPAPDESDPNDPFSDDVDPSDLEESIW